jgi:small-conductance mechanosensitive channel
MENLILGNLVQTWGQSLITFAIALLALLILKKIVLVRLEKLSQKTKFKIDNLIINIIQKIHWSFFVIASLYVAIQNLILPIFLQKTISALALISISYYLVKTVLKIIDFAFKKLINEREKSDKALDETVIGFLRTIVKVIVWAAAIILILQNLGYNVTALVGGLGIAGIAIGLALQNALSDVLAFFSIYFDKPFEVGDFIIAGDDMGTIKKIGVKTTRLTALSGQELIIPNKQLTEERINNYKKMKKRRIAFTIGVAYETPVAKLKKIPKIIKKMVEKYDILELNRVHFKTLGDFSLNYEIVFFVNSNDYLEYMDIQQEINLSLIEEFAKEKIEFAYPTQTVYVGKN